MRSWHSPDIGGRVNSYDDRPVAVSGVRAVVPVAAGVAVLADNTWAALQVARRSS
jgi:hypothetical protein